MLIAVGMLGAHTDYNNATAEYSASRLTESEPWLVISFQRVGVFFYYFFLSAMGGGSFRAHLTNTRSRFTKRRRAGSKSELSDLILGEAGISFVCLFVVELEGHISNSAVLSRLTE